MKNSTLVSLFRVPFAFLVLVTAGAYLAMPRQTHEQIYAVTTDSNGYGQINEYLTSGTAVSVPLISSGTTNWDGWGAMAVSGSNIYVVAYGSGNGPGTSRISEYSTSGTLVKDSFISGLNFPQARSSG